MKLLFAGAMVASTIASLASIAIPAQAQTPTSGAPDDFGYFDLGFTLSTLPRDSAGAKKWLATQPADAQRVILAACDNYVKHPIAVDMAETVTFCQALLAK